MDNWQATFLGLKQLPRELIAFEIEAFFTFTLAERQLIEDRRRPALELGLAGVSGAMYSSLRAIGGSNKDYAAYLKGQLQVLRCPALEDRLGLNRNS